MSGESPLRRFRDVVCSFRIFYVHLLALQVAIAVILLFSLATLEAGGGADYLLLQIDLVVLAVTLGATVAALYACREY
jgi:hypothetical protein